MRPPGWDRPSTAHPAVHPAVPPGGPLLPSNCSRRFAGSSRTAQRRLHALSPAPGHSWRGAHLARGHRWRITPPTLRACNSCPAAAHLQGGPSRSLLARRWAAPYGGPGPGSSPGPDRLRRLLPARPRRTIARPAGGGRGAWPAPSLASRARPANPRTAERGGR